MFGFCEKEATTKRGAQDRRIDLHMALYEAKEYLFNKAISCKHCNDLGVAVVALRHIDSPDDVEIEYMRCDCGREPHQKLISLISSE